MDVARSLEIARKELVDISRRTRLLNTPRFHSRTRSVDVVGQSTHDIFQKLVREGKKLSFRPTPVEGGDPVDNELVQPEEVDAGDRGSAQSHRLQTRLGSEALQKRLLSMHYLARTFEEEQGISTLFMALGFLRWFESEASDIERWAPLILVPVLLERPTARSRFRIVYSGDELSTNLSLQAMLRSEYGLRLPDIPDDDDVCPSAYASEVRSAIGSQPRWQVETDGASLGFFSFSKFLMYRDLDPSAWPSEHPLEEHPLLGALLRDGFRDDTALGSEESVDSDIDPSKAIHVLDADSSQTLAIEEVRRGRSIVLQGPPGTGKSQTIINLMCSAVAEGKKVLFVAEKLAALSVVKLRLENIGLGDLCLELHSHKANRKEVLDDLRRAMNLGPPIGPEVQDTLGKVRRLRAQLSEHVTSLHTALSPSGLTPFRVLGQLVRLQREGVSAPDYEIRDAADLQPDDVQSMKHLVVDAARHVQVCGVPKEHPWRGVGLSSVLPTDVARLTPAIALVAEETSRAAEAGRSLSSMLPGLESATLGAAKHNASLAGLLCAVPPQSDRANVANPVWLSERETIDALLEAGTTLAAARKRLATLVSDAGWDTDVSAARQALAVHGRSWLRLLKPPYRQAQEVLRKVLTEGAPRRAGPRIRLLDELIRGQSARAEVANAEALGRAAFGSRWRGSKSDWGELTSLAQWEKETRTQGVPPEVVIALAELVSLDPVEDLSRTLREAADGAEAMLLEVAGRLDLDCEEAFGKREIEDLELQSLETRLSEWERSPEALSHWIAYRLRRDRMREEGLEALEARLHDGRLPHDVALGSFEFSYFEALMRRAFEERPDLAAFHGESHERVLGEFREADRRRIELARQEVAAAHFQGMPHADYAVGETGIVRQELAKRRRHRRVRRLLKDAGRAIQAIKPVFMMSPMSVAQYLEPGGLSFDLLLIDEASQVQPVDALGAVARAKQLVVVGDDKQLPPTRFFDKLIGADTDEEDTDGGPAAGDLESILGLAAAQGMPPRMLKWHYRSRHHSLIATSNREFYENRLTVVPSPDRGEADLGVRFRRVSDGVFDRGRSKRNQVEAQAVARSVMQHARLSPTKSLGVGTFSVAQRDAILDELELLRREDPSAEAFFRRGASEPFFVKNLETIQGDERDVVFISVGYGRDQSGAFFMNFGPLSAQGGERRLNVLITRARERCEVFSSIDANDIDLNRARGRGPQVLKSYLAFASTGQSDIGIPTGAEHDSEFERQVANALRDEGYETDAQVGVAGFFVDLGVKDPSAPGRYVLGIECDGASYHSARGARDRDRLRQQVLEDRGWAIHRIWSTDWFQRPRDELRRAVAAIEAARVGMIGRTAATACSDLAVERGDTSEDQVAGSVQLARPYVEADWMVESDWAPHEADLSDLAARVREIVEVEGPVHETEVGRRVARVWGLRRAGSRIQKATKAALEHASGLTRDRHGFWTSETSGQAVVRDRSRVESLTLRRPEMIPPSEIRLALLEVVHASFGAAPGDAVRAVARLLGFATTSAQLRGVVEKNLRELVAAGRLKVRAGGLSKPE